MIKTNLYNTKGEKIGQISLPEEIFKTKTNPQLIAQAIRVYLANQVKARAKTKTRSEVSGSGKKIYRQKGTGRARHGDRYAPIFVGGGVAHGPRRQTVKRLKLSKRMKRMALFGALSQQLKEKNIVIVDGLKKIKPKTKNMVKVIKNLKLEGKILLVLEDKIENIIRSARNIQNVEILQAPLLNTYQVLKANKLLLTKESVKKLKEVFLS